MPQKGHAAFFCFPDLHLYKRFKGRPVARISQGGVLFGGKVDLKPKGGRVSFGDLCTIPYGAFGPRGGGSDPQPPPPPATGLKCFHRGGNLFIKSRKQKYSYHRRIQDFVRGGGKALLARASLFGGAIFCGEGGPRPPWPPPPWIRACLWATVVTREKLK